VTITYATVDGTHALPWVDRLVDLYAVVYAEPPYLEGPEQVARFADILPDETTRPGFALVTAAEGELVGAAYGWTMPAGRWWTRAETDPPAELRATDKLAIMEWIVHPARQRAGIGGRLLDLLLANRLEPWATLASDPRSDARRIYERHGWQMVGLSRLPSGSPMHLLALPLPDVRVQEIRSS
jgi:GNAT superfamily N-acetyltransferase